MTASPSRFIIGAGTASLALALGAVPLLAMIPTASATPSGGGTNGQGSTTMHDATTDVLIQANDPHVCTFKLVSDNYATDVTTISYEIVNQAGGNPVSPATDLTGVISLTTIAGQNRGESAVLTLPNGHYKETSWQGLGTSAEAGADNWKTFWVDCAAVTPPPTTTPPTTPPPTTPPPTTPPPTTPPPTTPPPTTAPPTTAPPTVEPTTPAPTDSPTTPAATDSPTDTPTATESPITGGGGNPTVDPPVLTAPQPATKPVTRGSGTPTTAKTLPFTGSNTESLALWGLASLIGGTGFLSLGRKRGTQAR